MHSPGAEAGEKDTLNNLNYSDYIINYDLLQGTIQTFSTLTSGDNTGSGETVYEDCHLRSRSHRQTVRRIFKQGRAPGCAG